LPTLQNISAALKSSLTGSDLSESVGGLKSGVNLLLANYEEFHQGITAYTVGLKELEAGYVAFDGGMGGLYDGGAEILNGLNGLSGGASELSDGTDELYRQTSDMDSLISDKLEELVSGYDKSDYVATSFVTQGRELSSVQFVFKTEGIVGLEPEAPPAAIEEKPTFWNRLLSLFGL
jgi:X-X-X-Leu-X-X-Gly heptad repeat protein